MTRIDMDIAATIEPKSDQLNADDLIGRTMTIKITKVSGGATKEQPIDIHFEGDNGKPYKPCKSMRRVLVQLWGREGSAYVGRSMTLFRDEKVKFGGIEVGGIRISHMSDIDKEVTLALTASKASRKPFTVKPLRESGQRSAVGSQKAAEKPAEPEKPLSARDKSLAEIKTLCRELMAAGDNVSWMTKQVLCDYAGQLFDLDVKSNDDLTNDQVEFLKEDLQQRLDSMR